MGAQFQRICELIVHVKIILWKLFLVESLDKHVFGCP
jgi:hypothetical protein